MTTPRRHDRGLVHAYLGYDPKNFPSPTAPPPDVAGAAFDYAMHFGDLDGLTEEQLANAIRIDASQIQGLGPSLNALIAMLEERKARLLATYETDAARQAAEKAYQEQAATIEPKKEQRDMLAKAVREQQVRDLERLWYMQKNEHSPVSRGLIKLIERLGEKYQIEQMSGEYAFTGREPLTPDEAVELYEELKTIDKLLEQLRAAMKTAQLAIIDLDELSEMADEEGLGEQIQNLNQIQQQLEEFVRQEAERQGLEKTKDGYRLSPKAFALVRGKLLREIFADLQAARSGRHDPITGEGPVETTKTKGYEYGDSVSNLDVGASFVNAAIRGSRDEETERRRDEVGGGGITLTPDDLVIHKTRNTPKCATAILMDMSGSMRHGGQYVHVKRMALALDALIRQEYPGDHLSFVEMFSFAKLKRSSEIVGLMPKPVSIHNPVVRLKADMSDPTVTESRIPQHFTNIQHALSLARRVLSAQDTPNRQITLITDGLPTAHFEGPELYLLYPPDPRTEEATMREAFACAREGITINIFLLPSWSQTSEDVAFAQRMAQATSGRVFFTGGKDLDRFVLWDYVSMRRKVFG
ncbi:MAG: VWA domain-containing protein [Phycisphaerales bacterium]|nr:VWA domain-containing protein [Planctomycetota bacterium]MCH8508572.1 VWA domain-containing protein [Phycisphaerales bacterium]